MNLKSNNKFSSEYNLPKMMTIRQIAATGILPEHALRVMAKNNKLPAVKVGNKLLINYDKLVEYLENL